MPVCAPDTAAFGDGENSLIMSTGDETPEKISEQAELVGLTQIKVVDQPS